MSTMPQKQPKGKDESYVKIEKDVVEQHKTLLSLKQQHELLDQEIQHRIRQLSEAQQKRITIEEDIQTHSIRTMKKIEILAKEQAELANSAEKTKELQRKIKEDKAEQHKQLKLYEEKMAEISQKLRSGPKYFDRKNIQAEISNLRDETAAVAEELQAVEKELTELQHKYSLMLKVSANSALNADESHKLSNLRKVIEQLTEEKLMHKSEELKLIEELQSLAEVSDSLRGELNKYKQVEISLN